MSRDLGRWFVERDDDHIFQMGKHRGKSLGHVASVDDGYLVWMLREVTNLTPAARALLIENTCAPLGRDHRGVPIENDWPEDELDFYFALYDPPF